MNNREKRVKWIDSMRGIACLLVMFAHLLATNSIYGSYANGCGKIGVWLFFLLSGYFLLQTDDEINMKWVGKYYLKKVVKLYPVYLIGLLLAVSLGQIENFKSVVLHLLLIKGEGHFWYMCVILKFYIIAPFVIWLYRKIRKCFFLIGLIGIGIASMIIWPPYRYVENSTHIVWYIIVFIYGILLWMVWETQKEVYDNVAFDGIAVIMTGTILMLTPCMRKLVWGVEPSSFLQNKYWLLGLIWAVILWSIANGKYLKKWLDNSWFLNFMGKISYSVYIIHYIILQWLITTTINWEMVMILFFVGSILLGWGLTQINNKLNKGIKLK